MPPRPPSPTRRQAGPMISTYSSPRRKPPPSADDPPSAQYQHQQLHRAQTQPGQSSFTNGGGSPMRTATSASAMTDLNTSATKGSAGRQKMIHRAVFVDVVLERDQSGVVGADTQALLDTFGQPITTSDLRYKSSSTTHRRTQSTSTSRSRPNTPSKDSHRDRSRDDGMYGSPTSSSVSHKGNRASGGNGVGNRTKLIQLVNELKETEERYLRRITVLKQSYADPLRKFAKRPETLIIPLYDAKALFANIDALIIAAEDFAADLSEVDVDGRVGGRGIGDVCLKHLKDLGTFDCYRAYYDKQDESQRSFTNMMKRSPSFATFIESVKYQTSSLGIGNIGLRELLAEPVQRIPRYTLLWQGMAECMVSAGEGEEDGQREKLEEAIGLAADIALCETDERTRRATIMYCLDRTVEGFPVNLMSNSRDFVDCIDVDDIPLDWRDRPISLISNGSADPSSSSGHGHANPSSPSRSSEGGNNNGVLNATLFLFDDKLVIAKRQSAGISGCKATGLDDVDKLLKGGGGLPGLMQQGAGLRRDKLSFRGMVDILDIMVADAGDGDIQLFMEKPPLDQSDRWAGRPYRSLSVVQPPAARGLDVIGTRTEKERFIRNLWHSQALIKAKHLSAIVKRPEAAGCPGSHLTNVGPENVVSGFGGRDERIAPYTSLWDRSAWTPDPRKAKIALQIDESGIAETLPFSTLGGPMLVVRVQPLPGAICRWQNIPKDRGEGPNEEELIHLDQVHERITQAAITAQLCTFAQASKSPATTPTSFRHRPSMMNLDSISRNLFGAGSISSRGHSVTSSQRSKSIVSRSSTLDTSRYSVHSRSTAATTVDSEYSATSPEKQASRDVRPATSAAALSMVDEESGDGLDDPTLKGSPIHAHMHGEMDLDSRLELARKNSASAEKGLSASVSEHHRARHADLADDSVVDHPRPLMVRNRTPSPDSQPPVPEKQIITSPRLSPVRPLELNRHMSPPLSATTSTPAKSYGPLSRVTTSSPFRPETISPRTLPKATFADGAASLRPVAGTLHTRMQIVENATASSSTPNAAILNEGRRVSSGAYKRMRSQEDLAPRKRSIDRSPLEPLSHLEQLPTVDPRTPRKLTDKVGSLRKASGVTASSAYTVVPIQVDVPPAIAMARNDRTMYKTAISAKEHITVAMRTAQSMQGELKELTTHMGTDLAFKDRMARVGDVQPTLSRSPPSRQLSIRAHGSPIKAGTSSGMPTTPARHARRGSRTELDLNYMEEWMRSISSLIDQLALDLEHARGLQNTIVNGAANADDLQRQAAIDREAANGRLKRANNKLGLAQTQLSDLKAELETVYDAFNTELDCIFNDANLPPEEAYIALRTQLQDVTAERNQLRLDNLKLRTELQEATLRKEEWANLLRSHGILA